MLLTKLRNLLPWSGHVWCARHTRVKELKSCPTACVCHVLKQSQTMDAGDDAAKHPWEGIRESDKGVDALVVPAASDDWLFE